MNDPNGTRSGNDWKSWRELGECGGREAWYMGDRAAGAGAGEHTVVASPVRAAMMVMLMPRVVQQLRRKSFGADLERERLAVRRHESRGDERACRECRQHQAGGQSMGELSGLPGSHACTEANTAARRQSEPRRGSWPQAEGPGARSRPVSSAFSTARVRSRTPNLPRMLET